MSDNNEIIMMPLDETLADQNEEMTTNAISSADSEFVNEDNINEFKLLSLKSKVNDINSIMDGITNEQKKLLSDNEEFDPIDNILKNFTEEQIKGMSYDFINEILVDEDGSPIEFTIDFNGDVDKLNQFKKEFLILRKQSLTYFERFDKELADINKEIAESQEEFDKLVNEFGNISNLIRRRLEDRLETADTDRKKELFTKLLVSFNNGLDLDNVKAYCKSYKGKNILSDFRFEKNSQYVYRRYLKVAKALDIKTDLTSFANLEKRFLDGKYCERNNLFVFAIIHFISSWHNKDYTKADGLFITQFTINLKNLYYNKFDTEEDKETFINNIKEVINLIIG